MIRTLLATTALAALMSTGAMAQDTAPVTDTMAPATTEAPAAPAMAPAAGAAVSVDANATAHDGYMQPFEMSAGYTAVDTDNLATRLIDQPVYSSAGDEAEEIGNITDLVFNSDGKITAVVIGVGGFLGIGEKSVAVDFGALEFTVATDNTERWVLPTTADELNNAPDFIWTEDKPSDNTMNGADGMTPVDGMTPADPAMAPATN